MNTYSKLKLDDLMHALEAFADDNSPTLCRGRPLWASDKERFRTMWLAGVHVDDIAQRLNRTRGAIITMRCKFGFPPRRPQKRLGQRRLEAA